MLLAWERLNGRSGHDVAYQLLRRLYEENTGKNMPPISTSPTGKPYFSGESLHFSISHTKDHAFCCLSDTNVGIDAEPMDREVAERLAKKCLSASEFEIYQSSDNPADTFLRLWVLKEAYAKLTGKGLGSYLWETAFTPDSPEIQIIDGCYVAVLTEKENV